MMDFNDRLGQYISFGLLNDDVHDCFCPGVVEKAEEVLKKADISKVHSMTDFYETRKVLQERLQEIKEDKIDCMILLGRLNICLLKMDMLDSFTRIQVRESLPFAKKEISDRYLWAYDIENQLKLRLEQFNKFMPSSDLGDKKLLAVPEAFAR